MPETIFGDPYEVDLHPIFDTLARRMQDARNRNRQLSLPELVKLALAGTSVSGYVVGKLVEAAGKGTSSFIQALNENKKRLRGINQFASNPSIEPKEPSHKRLRGMKDKWLGGQPKPIPIENDAGTTDDVEMATNLTSKMGTAAIAHETPVSKIYRAPYGPVGETFSTIMPFHTRFSAVIDALGDPLVLKLRMGSINDIIVNAGTTSSSTGSAASAVAGTDFNGTMSSGNQRPAWYKYFTDRYQYYHVVHTKWKLTVRNYGTANDALAECSQFYTGANTPPWDLGGTEPTPMALRYWKGCNQRKTIYPAHAIYPYPLVTMSDTYRPGDHKREIRDDSEASTWTAVANNPALQEYAEFYFNHHPISNYSGTVGLVFLLEIEMLVQFKDLIQAYKYPLTSLTDFAPTNDVV